MSGINRNREKFFTSLLDLLIIGLAFYLVSLLKPEIPVVLSHWSSLNWLPGIVIHSIYWMIVFLIMGLYNNLYLISRFDEFIKVGRATIAGTLILYFLVTLNGGFSHQNILSDILLYSSVTGGSIALNRFIIRSIQRMYAMKGKGLHRAVIVGSGKTAFTAFTDLMRNKTLGLQVLGFVKVDNGDSEIFPEIDADDLLGDIKNIRNIIQELSIQEVIVALEPHKREELMDVISKVNNPDVKLKLLPDFYQLVSGLNKTNQIFGLPLIEISPDVMPAWEKLIKRALDILISMILLIVFAPVWFIVAISIKLTTSGPAIYSQKRVGKNGRTFTMYKFRTMYEDAESKTGPVWAAEDDPRITNLGYWLRKLRLDELPQFINVLKGDMSLVGPRPERPYFVEQFKKEIPLYSRRLRVRPGITGWAQVKWKYDSTLDDVKEKTKYDLFYVENMSLRMDFKILFNTIFTIIRAKGQ